MIDLDAAIAGQPPDVQANIIAEYALHALEITRILGAGASHGRGLVVPLTPEQRVNRALYLCGEKKLGDLDDYVRKDASTPEMCPDIFYLLKDHNGGKDPTQPDPADRWQTPGSEFVNRTCDCIGGASWVGGWDRYQPVRFAHLYGGWINTDSMMMDARGPQRCFKTLEAPEPGCYVVCASGSPGHRIGHIGTVIAVPPVRWSWKAPELWNQVAVVDVAARTPNKANARSTARGWMNADPSFIVPVMAA